jgi:hypothetical protein
MPKPRKIIWKIYFIVFSATTLANFLWTLYPETEPYVFYHILIAWTPFYKIHYGLAVFKCLMDILCLIPFYRFAFNLPIVRAEFWQWMFVVRLLSDVFGNFYEFVFIKSSYHMVLGYGLVTTGAFILPLVPAYIAHYLYAFPQKSRQ